MTVRLTTICGPVTKYAMGWCLVTLDGRFVTMSGVSSNAEHAMTWLTLAGVDEYMRQTPGLTVIDWPPALVMGGVQVRWP